jgi:hypothetical protein
VTLAEADYIHDYEPAKVHIVKDDTKGNDAPCFVSPTSKTYLAGTSPELICPRSQRREHASIAVLGVVGTAGNVILADNEADASAAAIYSGTINSTIPGMALQPGMVVDVYHHDEVWLARLGTTGTAPIVSVVTENKIR